MAAQFLKKEARKRADKRGQATTADATATAKHQARVNTRSQKHRPDSCKDLERLVSTLAKTRETSVQAVVLTVDQGAHV